MPGLIRAVGRTAVVAGTATAVSGNVRRRQEQKYADQDAGQQAPPPQAAPAAGGDMVGKLTQLAEMNASGTLTDEQFAAAARKELLGQ
ncbi:MAG: SHOCT domain-containing protein [Acidobacteria bacterium]|nr:SHOCT domain-containing protein [Acidobacteriota bacterium]